MACTSVVTVVLPLVPVTATIGMSRPARRELELAPHRHAGAGGEGEHRVARGHARAQHDHARHARTRASRSRARRAPRRARRRGRPRRPRIAGRRRSSTATTSARVGAGDGPRPRPLTAEADDEDACGPRCRLQCSRCPRGRGSRRRRRRAPSAANSPARIQKRTMTVVSGQPRSSKWWWIGAMRNTRRPKSRKLTTWIITDSVSITNRPPMTGSSRWRLAAEAQRGQARADGERAGVAHEDPGRRRVPPQEAGAAADHAPPRSRARSRALAGAARGRAGWRNCQKPITARRRTRTPPSRRPGRRGRR